jgi:HK97 family phage major capsid protein
MDKLKALREKRAAAVAAMRAQIDAAAADNRTDLNETEAAAYEAAKAEEASFAAAISRLEETLGLEATLAEVRPAAARGQGTENGNAHAPGAPAVKEFETFGEFLASVRFNPNDQRLSTLFSETVGQGANLDVRAEQRMDTGEQGGFMVPQQFRSTILKVDPQTSLVRSRAQVIPAGTPPDAAISMPALDQGGDTPSNVFGGVEVTWIAEGVDKPETDAKLREIKLEPHEVAGTVVITDKLLRNWAAAGPFLENLLRGAVTQSEDYAFTQGDGIGKPYGARNSAAAYHVNRTSANDVVYLDLVAMVARVLLRGGSPVWSMSQSVMPKLFTLQDPDGRYIFVLGAANGLGSTLLGYPIVWNNRQPQLGNEGDIMLSDFSFYLIKDGSGPFVASSEHVLFRQNKTVIKIFWNVDGQPWLTAPFKEENGYEVSPFVVLDDPA